MYEDKREEGKALVLKELEKIEGLTISTAEAKEVLEHHLEQLRKAGATLEDQTAQVLRKVQEQAAAAERIKELRREYFIY